MKMLIDSRWVDSTGGEVREVTNPGTGEVLDTVPAATIEDIDNALEAAQHGKERMRALPAHKRHEILVGTAGVMQQRHEELARLLAQENGKPIRQTREEISAAIRIFRGFGEEAKRIFGKSMSLDSIPGMERHFALTIRQPVGVVAAIVPFNYPVELYCHKGPAALAAGNAVIVKPPSDCPLTLLKIAEILEECGLPQGAHQVITGSGATIGDYISSSPGVDMITVTGSTAVGKRISRLASETLKKVHLELGGNDPTIVCADADLDRAAEAVILGRMARGNGQICCAVKRVFVDTNVHDAFCDILSEKTEKLIVGDQLDDKTDVGPLITEKAAIDVENDIKEAIELGGRVRTGGNRRGAFIFPTVLTGVPAHARVRAEETFGPVVPVEPFSSLAEAVRLANDSPYGLQGAVFTQNLSHALDIAYKLEVGGVVANWSSAVRAENLPFGGLKLTGNGREGIHDTLNEMTEQKTILMYDALSVYGTGE